MKTLPVMQTKGKLMKPQVSESPGAALVGRIRAEMAEENLEPDAREGELLSLAEELADRIAELEAAIAADGLTSSKGGLVRLHPGIVDARQTRTALARVLSEIQMRDDSKNPVKQRPADRRSYAHNVAKRQVS
jgi:hypothetical protein